MKDVFSASAKAIVFTTAFVILGACSSNGDKPGMALNAAESQMELVEQMDAAQYAPMEFKSAKMHIDSAKKAVDDEEYKEAKRLIEKAEIDIRLAAAKTKAVKASESAEKIRDNLNVLEQNI